MKKISVLCLFGGRSSEYEVSLNSVYSILSNIDREKYTVHTLGITKEGKWLYYSGDAEYIKDGTWCERDVFPAMIVPDFGSNTLYVCKDGCSQIHIDVVFPVMHGAYSEDGTLQGLLEMSGLPYVGPGCLASAVAMDKVFTKLVLNNFEIPQAEYTFFKDEQIHAGVGICADEAEKKFSYPMFVKPANAGSSVGTGKATDRKALEDALLNAAKYDSKVIIEEYIKGKEIEVAVMGNGNCLKISCPGEIDPGSDYYDYDTKYKNNTSSVHIPAVIPEDTASKVRDYAKTIYCALGCKGMSRVDFFVCENGRIVFNEINTLPGFTTISMYPKLFIHEKMSYSEIIDNLIALAIESKK
jgi:D-alanine-D-alanine ligase